MLKWLFSIDLVSATFEKAIREVVRKHSALF